MSADPSSYKVAPRPNVVFAWQNVAFVRQNLEKLSLTILGFGCSALLVASFGSAQIAAVQAGFPETMEVQAVVSGQQI